MKKYFALGALIIGIFSIWFYSQHPLQPTVTVHNVTFFVDVAVTPKEKEIGLGNRPSLAPYQGMLFAYDHREMYSFWMKNMRFPIDILWIADRTIVDITQHVPVTDATDGKLPIYRPNVPVDKVLELPAGTVDRVGIIIGDIITIKS